MTTATTQHGATLANCRHSPSRTFALMGYDSTQRNTSHHCMDRLIDVSSTTSYFVANIMIVHLSTSITNPHCLPASLKGAAYCVWHSLLAIDLTEWPQRCHQEQRWQSRRARCCTLARKFGQYYAAHALSPSTQQDRKTSRAPHLSKPHIGRAGMNMAYDVSGPQELLD